MDKKSIRDILICVVLVVGVLILSIIATNKLSKDDSDTFIDTPVINRGKTKNNDTFCGVLITSGTDWINDSQHQLFENPKLYADFNKETSELTFEGKPIIAKTTKNADYYVVKEHNGKNKMTLDIKKADFLDYTYYYSTSGAFLNGDNLYEEK